MYILDTHIQSQSRNDLKHFLRVYNVEESIAREMGIDEKEIEGKERYEFTSESSIE